MKSSSSKDTRDFFRSLLLCATAIVGASALLSVYLAYIVPQAVLIGALACIGNLLAQQLVVRSILDRQGGNWLGLVVIAIKLPLLVLLVMLLSRQGGDFIISTLLGFLVFVPAAFIAALRAPQRDSKPSPK